MSDFPAKHINLVILVNLLCNGTTTLDGLHYLPHSYFSNNNPESSMRKSDVIITKPIIIDLYSHNTERVHCLKYLTSTPHMLSDNILCCPTYCLSQSLANLEPFLAICILFHRFLLLLLAKTLVSPSFLLGFCIYIFFFFLCLFDIFKGVFQDFFFHIANFFSPTTISVIPLICYHV